MELNSDVILIAKSPKDYQAFRISPRDTNRLANDNVSTYCVENFDLRGKTSHNCHSYAAEMFFILKGKGSLIRMVRQYRFRRGTTC